jgi:hypothetical protein
MNYLIAMPCIENETKEFDSIWHGAQIYIKELKDLLSQKLVKKFQSSNTLKKPLTVPLSILYPYYFCNITSATYIIKVHEFVRCSSTHSEAYSPT